MATSDEEMVRKLTEAPAKGERSTSLQATYEDSVPPDPEDDWELEQD